MFCIDSVDIDSIECIRDPCLVSTVLAYIVLIVGLKSPQSKLSKTFLRIENQLNTKKVMGRNVWMCFVLTVSTYSLGHCIQSRVEFSHLITLYTVLCKSHQCRQCQQTYHT